MEEVDFSKKKLIVFDLDGTLTESKSNLDIEMSKLITKLLKLKKVAVISGGSYKQFTKQFLENLNSPQELLENLFLFPTCSSSFYKYDGIWKNIYQENLSGEESEKIMKAFSTVLQEINFQAEKVFGELIENRGSQITFSALGQEAPIELKRIWDPDHRKRSKMVKLLEKIIPEFEIRIGGTTSIDISRKGIDKAYGIKKIQEQLGFEKDDILFMGDALFEGGNDYPVKNTGVDCIEISNVDETKKLIQKMIQ